MRYILFVLMISVSLSFAKSHEDHPIVLEHEGAWKFNFKNEVIGNILYKMYGIDFITCCLAKDASSTANWGWLNYDSLTEVNINKITEEFIARHTNIDDIEGVPIKLNYALEFRVSHELDSLTGVYYKQYQQDSTIKSEAYYNSNKH